MTTNKENEERSAGNLKVSNFHCSEHGYIKPEPHCPKCLSKDKQIQEAVSLREQELWDKIENKAKGAEFTASITPNASVVLLSVIQSLLKSNLKE